MSKENPNELKIINKNERLHYRQIINQFKQQLEEKDKEIERLKDFISCKGCVDVIKKSNDNQTQLAIQELEKVKAKVRDVSGALALCEVEVQINNQIKELKGE